MKSHNLSHMTFYSIEKKIKMVKEEPGEYEDISE